MRIRILGFEEGHAALELDGTPPLRSVGRKCLLLGIILHLYCGGKVHSSPRVKANLLYAASSHGVPCYDSLHESCFARLLSERISRSRVIYIPPNHVVWDAHMRIPRAPLFLSKKSRPPCLVHFRHQARIARSRTTPPPTYNMDARMMSWWCTPRTLHASKLS